MPGEATHHIPTVEDTVGTLICVGPDRYHPLENTHYPSSFGGTALMGTRQESAPPIPQDLEATFVVQRHEQQAA